MRGVVNTTEYSPKGERRGFVTEEEDTCILVNTTEGEAFW
jgi:hypothetical protein